MWPESGWIPFFLVFLMEFLAGMSLYCRWVWWRKDGQSPPRLRTNLLCLLRLA